MATGQKISAQTVATTWSGSDLATIVQSGVNKSITHDVFMDDTQICKAWLHYDHTAPSIIDDFNVSSVTDNATGVFTINFTNNMNDANYAVLALPQTNTSAPYVISGNQSTPNTVSACRITVTAGTLGSDSTASFTDLPHVSVAIFGS